METGAAPQYCVIWLHGLGADGRDFTDLPGMLNLPAQMAVRFLFPHAPMRPITLNGGMTMRGWYDLTGSRSKQKRRFGWTPSVIKFGYGLDSAGSSPSEFQQIRYCWEDSLRVGRCRFTSVYGIQTDLPELSGFPHIYLQLVRFTWSAARPIRIRGCLWGTDYTTRWFLYSSGMPADRSWKNWDTP